MKKVNIGLIGFGMIGAAVVKVLRSRRAYLRARSGMDLVLSRICDKDIKSKRPIAVDKRLLTRSIGKVLYDPKIDVVVELVGGVHPARDIAMEALRRGKHVVTANKALLSEFGPQILGLADSLGLSVGFEASVGGGVPIIRALKESFAANRIEIIYGIVNGTSNFILSRMSEGGVSFDEALRSAQGRGYAERDPRLDISGGDSAHKLAILAMLGFGAAARPGEIYTEGIDRIEAADIEYAGEMGYAVKPLAIAKRSGASGLELRVHPTLIPRRHLLASSNGVYNAIFVKGDLIGENLFYGEGAGPNPTSSAVVSDIIAAAKNVRDGQQAQSPYVELEKRAGCIKRMEDVELRHYIRFSALDKPGVLARISGILAKFDISIASVTQKAKNAKRIVPIVMMTHEARERDMAKAMKEIDALGVIKKKSVRIRVEE